MSKRNRAIWVPLLWYGLAVAVGIMALEGVDLYAPFSKAFTLPFECLAVWDTIRTLNQSAFLQAFGLVGYVWCCLAIGLSGWTVIAYLIRLAYTARNGARGDD